MEKKYFLTLKLVEGQNLSAKELEFMLSDGLPQVTPIEEISIEPLSLCPRCGNQTLLLLEREEYRTGLGITLNFEGLCLKSGRKYTPRGY